jgi:enoyl-CoA hydratase/carnithine racemase
MTTETSYETLKVTREGNVAIASIANPPMNVLGEQMARDLIAFCDEVEGDSSVRAVLFRSDTPGVFMAGADISMLNEISEATLETFREVRGVMDRIAVLPQPTVVAIGGTCLGGGFELALACDFRFMAQGFGEIGLPEVRLGLLPGGGGTQRLPRLVGAAKATEMLLKGMRYSPDVAAEIGIVHKVFEQDALDAEALKYATSLAAQAPLAVQYIKQLVRAAFETPADGLQLEKDLFEKLAQTADAKEGISAFFEGRKANFTGS